MLRLTAVAPFPAARPAAAAQMSRPRFLPASTGLVTVQ